MQQGRPGAMAGGATLDSSRYELGPLLGRGGLGEVYRAHDRSLKRDVAIKFVAPDRVADPAARRALLREARAAAALDHPYICTVYEAGETADGRGYIVMQYIDGQTLSSILQRGPMPVRDALALCADVAEALAAAHRAGVIHRDLKPGNIMVTAGGRPKLVDFGIAKVVVSPSEAVNASTVTASTLVGIIGTPAYMSPEQIQQRTIDARSDLFSLGVVLFECLTGRGAFTAPTPVESVANVLHVHPAAPSTLRAGMTEAHDELCRRLLAKEPADRFQSAEEVVGAIRVLLPDTSRTPTPIPPRPGRRVAPAVVWVIAALSLAGVSGGTWRWLHPVLPVVPEESERWYRSGIDAMREGSYATARARLEKAVEMFPDHVRAYSRLAEADAELDEREAAEAHLLRVSTLVPNEARLPTTERLRLAAVRAVVLRDLPGAIDLYKQLVARTDSDAGALVDLGRAQEAAGLNNDARGSYEQAIARDAQYAAAYLRLGRLEGLESRQKEALAAFAKAEELYKASGDIEGQAVVALERGRAYDGFNDLAAARADLERSIQLAGAARSPYHQVRAQLALSGVMASEGKLTESQRLAEQTVKRAEDEGLAVTAAGGLVDLGFTLLLSGNAPAAAVACQRAIDLAEGRKAWLTVARAKVQLAEIKRTKAETLREALALTDSVLPFLARNRYRRLELQAQLIAARAHEGLDELEPARDLATTVLKASEAVHDDGQWASAASTLASISSAFGNYPEALRLRERAAQIYRRQGDNASLPFDLTNRADLLIRLNRVAEADALLAEVEKGITEGRESFGGRRRRTIFLRAFEAVTSLRCREVGPRIAELSRDTKATDSGAIFGSALVAFCDPRERPGPLTDQADAASTRERQYWIAAAAVRRRDAAAALQEATKGLTMLGARANDELRWRLAIVGAIAADGTGNAERGAELRRTAADALQRLRATFGADFPAYEQRPDLAELRKKERI